MFVNFFFHRLAAIIGNILGNYDKALFALLAPFLAPLFFEGQDPVTALILTYAMLPLGFLTKPLGSLFFGWLGDRFGRKYGLCFSLLGLAIATVGIGFLPVYRQVGVWAPVLLGLSRMVQSFFAAGESSVAVTYILERTENKKRSFMSSVYSSSSILGMLVASGLIALLSAQGQIEKSWRILFWLGGFTAFFGLFLRLKLFEEVETVARSSLRSLLEHKKVLLGIVLVSGFSYVTYALAFTLMNGYIPLVTPHSKTAVMQINTLLLGVDMLLLPLFGYLAGKIGKEKLMILAVSTLAVSGVWLFAHIDSASLGVIIAVRVIIVTLGVAFAAPYHAWAFERVPEQHRCAMMSFGAAIGSQLIGVPTSAICLWLYQKTGWVCAPGFYLMGVAILALIAMRRSQIESLKILRT